MIPGYTTVETLRALIDHPALKDDDLIAPSAQGNLLVYREHLGMWINLNLLSNQEE